MVGYQTVTIRSNERGGIDLDALREALGPDVAALMITNPSTLGHLRGPDRPGPRGGPRGGRDRLHGRREPERDPRPLPPGRGRLRRHALQPAQDVQHAARRRGTGRRAGRRRRSASSPTCRGRCRCWPRATRPRCSPTRGPAARPPARASRSTGIGRRASARCAAATATSGCSCAPTRTSARTATAACGRSARTPSWPRTTCACGCTTSTTCPYDRLSKHEVVFSGRRQKREHGVTTLDIAKAILDHGIHPPTVYFPLIVEEALMVEPTETETLETLDHFVGVMREIAETAATDPDAIKRRPDDDAGRPPRRGRRRAAAGSAPPLRRRRRAAHAGRRPQPPRRRRPRERGRAQPSPYGRHRSERSWTVRRTMSNPHGGRPAQVPVEAKQPDDLVERMQGGDVDAFEEFFNTYKRPIYATALAITRDPFLAEEVLQDCFVKAYRVRERLDPARSPLPWLQRVTINLCYSRVSRRKALSEPLTSLITNLVVDLATRPGPGRRVARGARGAPARDRCPAAEAADRDHPLLPARLLAGRGRRDRRLQRRHDEVPAPLRAQGAPRPPARSSAASRSRRCGSRRCEGCPDELSAHPPRAALARALRRLRCRIRRRTSTTWPAARTVATRSGSTARSSGSCARALAARIGDATPSPSAWEGVLARDASAGAERRRVRGPRGSRPSCGRAARWPEPAWRSSWP